MRHLSSVKSSKVTDAELFQQIGEFLYGTRYQRSLAAALDRNERTVRRYASGGTAVSDELWARLALLLAAHEDRLNELGNALVNRVREASGAPE